MEISDTIQCVAVVFSLIFGVVGIYISINQIKISNKQALFDKRLKIYQLLEILKQNQEEANLIKIIKPEDTIDTGRFMAFLTNNGWLENMMYGWNDDLEKKENHMNFLKRIEEIRLFGMQGGILFDVYVLKYFYTYADLLQCFYKYRRFQRSCNGNVKEDKQLEAKLHSDIVNTYKKLITISMLVNLQQLEKKYLRLK